MSPISHVWKGRSIVSKLKTSILLRCCAKVMFSRVCNEMLRNFQLNVFYVTCIFLF